MIDTLEKQFNKERSTIEHAIDTSNLTDENKAWLRLLFHFLSYDGNDTLQNYEVINTEADSFLQNYSSSEKIDFVKEYIRYRYAVSPWGFGGEFFTGGGFYNGRLSNSFTNTVAFGFDVDIYYKKTIFYLRELFGISGSIKQDFNYKNYWHENEPLILFFPELSVGYTVAETRHFSLAPFGGIASAYIHLSPAVADTATNNVELPYKTTYVAGINIDFKFSSSGDIAYNVPYYKARAWYIRLRLAYCATTFQELDPRFKGNIFYFTIGVGVYGHKIKRV